ncbi:MAG: alpha amylase C-terminal domain-containing protein [Candidatus Eisenbacteria bacterium]
MKAFLLAGATAVLIAAAALSAAAAGADNNVEWSGVSHVAWQDRRPLCPLSGETFEVRIQTYGDDITSARVRVDDGTVAWIGAAKTAARGPFDIWAAQVPSTASNTLSYYIELTDGTDVDYLSVGGVTDATPSDGGFALNFTTLEHAPLGSTPASGSGAVFRVWAPGASTAHVRGQFNGWGTSNPMTKNGDYFSTYVSSTSDRQTYKYYFDGAIWKPDARAKSLNSGDNYNTHIEDRFRYNWQVDDFDTPDFEEMVIYQLHVGTFAGRNDPYGSAPFPAGYPEVTARAAHLSELGVNAVMLNPITEFPWDYSAGYNPISAWAPEWAYGSPDEFKEMIDTLHGYGIAVLLDIVYNHFSHDDNFLWEYDGTQIYFDDPVVETPWGSQADFDSGPVRDYFADASLYWLEEFKVDGFRMDATDFMNIAPQEAAGWSLMQRLNDEMDNRWIDKIAIAEQLPDDPWVTRPTSLGGAGYDSQYYDEFTDRLRDEIFDAASGDPEMWRILNIVNGGGTYLEGRYVTNYLELHDETWPSSGGQRIVKSIDTVAPHDDQWARGRTKLAQGVVMTAPGIPAIIMGTEWLEDTDFGTDPGNRIDWSKKTTYAPIFSYYQDLITLRRTNDALRADAGRHVFQLNESGNVIAWQRWHGLNVVVVVANFSNTDYGTYRIGLPQAGEWHEAVNSQASAYGGNGMENPGAIYSEAVFYDGFDQSTVIQLPGMGLVVLSYGTQSDVPEEGSLTDGLDAPRIAGAHPNPFNPGTSIAFELAHAARVSASVYDAVGRLVRTLADREFPAGASAIDWDGRDESGRQVASGVYFARLATENDAASAKLVLLR